MADPSTRIFRASLRGRLYHDLELPSGGSLKDLAAAILGAFGFDFDHAFGFYGSLGHRYHDETSISDQIRMRWTSPRAAWSQPSSAWPPCRRRRGSLSTTPTRASTPWSEG
jgi:hypothetical protein